MVDKRSIELVQTLVVVGKILKENVIDVKQIGGIY